MKFQIKGNYFNGKYINPSEDSQTSVEKTIKRESPADLDNLLWECPVSYGHVDHIIESANAGFKFWRKLPLEERIVFLRKFQDEVKKRKEDIAEAIALEAGKPLWESMTEAAAVIGKVDVTINESLPRVQNKTIADIMPDTTGHVYYKPIGPCLVIGPFNFPCHLANTQILAALITGNSIVFKPSEKTCYSAQLLMDCFHEAGFPKGVINLIQGDGEVASRLVKSKSMKGIFFTGSKEVGQKILTSTSSDLSKMVALELGGKNPAILHKDANLDHALQELIKGAFLTSGQRCTSTSIIAIERSISEEFIGRFHEMAKRIIIDHPIDHEVAPFMGPLVDERAVESYLLFMGMAKREGHTEIMRGKHLEKKYRGHYVSPSIHLAEKMDLKSHFLTSEIFGPNCTFIPYDTIDEAIEISNSTEYGLAAALFTKDKEIFNHCVTEIDAGVFNLNRSTCGASAKLPFGGVKNSGNYKPAAVAMIDSCVYQMASLEMLDDNSTIGSIVGIQ